MQKTVVITGGSKGLGRSLAKEFVEKGYEVVICARHKDEVEAVATEIGATPFVADIAKEEDVESLVDFVIRQFGKIDIWINNAGTWVPHASVEALDMNRVRQMFEPNVFGVMNGSKHALVEMRRQSSGMIVNIISTSGLSGRATSSSYAASKWAVRGFTDSLREECKGSGIKIIGVYPGGMQTEFFNERRPGDIDTYMDPDAIANKIIENIESKTPQEEQILKRPSQ